MVRKEGRMQGKEEVGMVWIRRVEKETWKEKKK